VLQLKNEKIYYYILSLDFYVIIFKYHNNIEMAAPGTNPQHARFFTYSSISHTYTAAEKAAENVIDASFGPGGNNQRHIPIQEIGHGMLLFHYFQLPPRNIGESDQNYKFRLLAVILRQYQVPIHYDPATSRWEFCFGSKTAKPHYYYPVPIAGTGIGGWGGDFNACITSVTTRDTKWAYLKSGTSADENVITHRMSKIHPHRNYDFLRVKMCSDLNAPNQPQVANRGYCWPGTNYDICLRSMFQRNNNIDGVTSIAGADCIMDITRQNNAYVYNTQKDMFRGIQEWRNSIIANGNRQEDLFVWAMNLLALETDKKDNTINVGYREFSTGPFGSSQLQPGSIPPNPLPPQFGQLGVDYWIVEQQFDGQPPVCIKRKFQFANNGHIILNFIINYIENQAFSLPIGITTPHGSIDFDHQIEQFMITPVNHIPVNPVIMAQHQQANVNQQRYSLHHLLSSSLYVLANGAVPRIRYDIRLNVFFDDRYSNHNVLDIRYDLNPAAIGQIQNVIPQLLAPPYSHNRFPLMQYAPFLNNASIIRCQQAKIMHEVISNTKWNTYWMNEFIYSYSNAAADTYVIPVGPFRNPLYLPFGNIAPNPANSGEIIGVYRDIINRMEPIPFIFGGGGYIPSATRDYLNSIPHTAYLTAWANNNNMGTCGRQDGTQHQYHQGRWFSDILLVGQQFGGGKQITKKRVQTSKRKTNRKTNRKTKKNSTIKSRSNKSSSYKNISHNSVHVKGGKHKDKPYNSNNSNSSYSINYKEKTTSNSSSYTTTNDGRPPSTFVPMNKDTFDTLVSIFKDPIYGEIFKSFYKNNKTSEGVNK
jgi:hypothetical protein